MKRQHNKVDRLPVQRREPQENTMKSLQDKMDEMPESRQDTIARSAAELRDVDAWIKHAEHLEELIEVMLNYLEDHTTPINGDEFRRLKAREMTIFMNRPGRLGQAMERRNY